MAGQGHSGGFGEQGRHRDALGLHLLIEGIELVGGYGVASDSFSFWDQTSDDLSAKGNGGMRQLYNYATVDSNMRIEAPKEDYAPDKIGSVSLENLQQQRNTEIQFNAEKQAKAVEHPSQQQFIQQQQQNKTK
jgi:hypothetical protein